MILSGVFPSHKRRCDVRWNTRSHARQRAFTLLDGAAEVQCDYQDSVTRGVESRTGTNFNFKSPIVKRETTVAPVSAVLPFWTCWSLLLPLLPVAVGRTLKED